MVHHRKFQRMLPLLEYGELAEPEARLLERHLAGCDECRRDLDGIRRLHTVLARLPAPEPTEELLAEARVHFRSVIARQRTGAPLKERLAEFLPVRPPLRLAMAGGGLLLLAIGFVLGRLLLPGGGDNSAAIEKFLASGGEIRVTNLQRISNGQQGGEIELTFDAVKATRIRGSLNDARIQKVLAYALVKGGNPGVRLRAAGSVAETQSALPEREVKAALVLAVKTDRNDGVRREALRALLRYPADREVRDLLLHVLLNDANPGLRIAAINGLDTIKAVQHTFDETTLQKFRQIEQRDDNLYVRTKARSILEEEKQ